MAAARPWAANRRMACGPLPKRVVKARRTFGLGGSIGDNRDVQRVAVTVDPGLYRINLIHCPQHPRIRLSSNDRTGLKTASGSSMFNIAGLLAIALTGEALLVRRCDALP